jgi:hypothetical protein
MEWTITLNEKPKYAEVVTYGIADREGSLKMAKELYMVLSKAKMKKILIDHSNISAVSGRMMEVYNRPKEFQETKVPFGIKVAEVIKAEHTDFFRFFETVCVNRGFIFSIFENKKLALEWLLQQ